MQISLILYKTKNSTGLCQEYVKNLCQQFQIQEGDF